MAKPTVRMISKDNALVMVTPGGEELRPSRGIVYFNKKEGVCSLEVTFDDPDLDLGMPVETISG